jgi:hypothetical protein
MLLSKYGRSLLFSSSPLVFRLFMGSPLDSGESIDAYIAIGSLEPFSDNASFCGLALADATRAADSEGDLTGTGRRASCCSIGRGAGLFFTRDLVPAAAAAAAAP